MSGLAIGSSLTGVGAGLSELLVGVTYKLQQRMDEKGVTRAQENSLALQGRFGGGGKVNRK